MIRLEKILTEKQQKYQHYHLEKLINTNVLQEKLSRYKYDFQQFETIRYFGVSIYSGKISIDEAEMEQTKLLENIVDFSNNQFQKKIWIKNKMVLIVQILISTNLYEGRKLILNPFRSGIFPIKKTEGKCLKILAPKQMLQRLPIALLQVNTGKTSENLLNEIGQVTYSLHRAKEVTKKVCNNIMYSGKV